MTAWRYSMNSAFDAGEKRHPQLVILEHFPDATNLEPVSIADCWLFEAEKKGPVPDYFVELPRSTVLADPLDTTAPVAVPVRGQRYSWSDIEIQIGGPSTFRGKRTYR